MNLAGLPSPAEPPANPPRPPDAIAHPVFEDATQSTGHPFRQISPERAAGRVVVFQRLGESLIGSAR